jgi:hypothetical protein
MELAIPASVHVWIRMAREFRAGILVSNINSSVVLLTRNLHRVMLLETCDINWWIELGLLCRRGLCHYSPLTMLPINSCHSAGSAWYLTRLVMADLQPIVIPPLEHIHKCIKYTCAGAALVKDGYLCNDPC